ncbi:MAG: glycosyltransferase family 4 protein, partial [Candidatus Helarchaeales archaeon]
MLSHTPLPDSRVEKEAKFLASLGHEVEIVCPYIKKKKRFRYFSRIWSFGSIKKLLIHTIFPNILQGKFLLFDIIRRVRPSVLHVHDIVMVIPALIISRIARIPLIYDSHEAWELYGYSNFRNASFFSKPNHFFRYIIYSIFQRIAPKKARFFIVTHELMARHYERTLGLDPRRIRVIRNVVDLDELRERTSPKDLVLNDKRLEKDLKNPDVC